MSSTAVSAELSRQINTLLQKGYPQAAGLSPEAFLRHVEPLIEQANDLVLPEVDLEQGHLACVIVVKHDLVATEKAMALVERDGRSGVSHLYPRAATDFQPIDDVRLPTRLAYLIIAVDRGKATINLPPRDALTLIRQDHRSPLTIDEGIALITHYPEFLIKNNCFSLLASRYRGDKRVPAIWINKDKRPNLGWCWDGNPHTWLGSASCGSRI